MTFSATYLGSSGWLLDFHGFRVLVDPWLRGPLTFSPGPWLIEGNLQKEIETPENISLILLTQGLPDHAHPPSLSMLNKSIRVIGSPSAAKLSKELGFENVLTLKPGTEQSIDGLTVQAKEGAYVPFVENAYFLDHAEGSVYLEPHGFLDASIPCREVDIVITPVVDLLIPIVGSFVKGRTLLPEIINRFKPLKIFASTIGGDAEFKGLLPKFIRTKGSYKEARQIIGNQSDFIEPIPFYTYEIHGRTNQTKSN